MNNDPSVILSNVTFDYYRLGNKRNSIKSLFTAKPGNLYLKKRAIDNVTFEIKQGETVGLIGKNGSGKSTLLKVIAGLYPPFEGRVEVFGKISPLMDLGAGFHPELSAKENILLNSYLLGNPEPNVTDIISWADLNASLNSPIRTFSSGMTARLAFSIATSINPDVLLVDEVLSVGDESFREKSLLRMRELLASDCTVVLVSHNLETLREECNQIIWMEAGRVVLSGDPDFVLSQYLKRI